MNSENSTCNFGEHITIDGYGGDPEKLNDKELVVDCLNELTQKLQMKILTGPHISYAPDSGHKDPGGWSGMVVIAESHISIHTFPKRRFLSADVYSCRNGLNEKLIIDYFREKFDIKEVEKNFVKRGTRYPMHNIV